MGNWDREVTRALLRHRPPLPVLQDYLQFYLVCKTSCEIPYVIQDYLGCKWQKPHSNRHKQKLGNLLALKCENPRVFAFRYGWILALEWYQQYLICPLCLSMSPSLSLSLSLSRSLPPFLFVPLSPGSAVLCMGFILKQNPSHNRSLECPWHILTVQKLQKKEGAFSPNSPVNILWWHSLSLTGSASIRDLGSRPVLPSVFAWPANYECFLHF